MTCQEGVLLLTDYLEGVVTAEQRGALDGHVAGCVRCQRFLKSYLRTPVALRAASAEAMSATMRERVRRRLGFR